MGALQENNSFEWNLLDSQQAFSALCLRPSAGGVNSATLPVEHFGFDCAAQHI